MRGFEQDPNGRTSRRLFVFAVVSSVAVVALASVLITSVFISAPGTSLGWPHPRAKTPSGRVLTVAIVRTPGGPAEWRTYARAIKKMSDATGRPMRVRYLQDRREIVELMRTREVDAGFLCTNCYLDLADAGVSLVAVPRIAGENRDAAVLVVRGTSPYTSLKDLTGHRVGVIDPSSLAGYTYLYWLAASERVDVARSLVVVRGESEEQNIRALLVGDVEAVVVNRSQLAPWKQANLRVVSCSPEYGMPPFVTGPTVDTETRMEMKEALLSMPASAEQPHSVVEGFSEAAAGDYEFAQELAKFSRSSKGAR